MRLSDVIVETGVPLGRTGWTFPYRPDTLRDAAAKQGAWHREREAFYIGEAGRLEAELRASGVELREQQITGGARFAAVLDPQLGEQLAEARQRRDRHAMAAKRFETYAGAFGELRDGTRHLTVEDVDYFALHREPGE